MIQETRKELPSILADLKAKKQVESSKILQAILVTLLGNDVAVIEAQKKIKTLENQVSHLNNRVKKLEVESYKTKVLLRNVPYHDSVRGRSAQETSTQTTEVVTELFEVMGVDMRTVETLKRIPFPKNRPAPSYTTNKTTYPVVQVIFTCFNDRKLLFSKVSKLADHEKFGKVSVEPDVPPCLLFEHKLASTKAYELRKKHVKTRIVISYLHADVVILTKNPRDSNFSTLPRSLWFKEDPVEEKDG